VTGQPYTIIATAGGATINFSALFKNLTQTLTEGPSFTEGPLTYSMDYDSTFVKVTFTAVPEPATAGLIGIGTFMLLLGGAPRRLVNRRPVSRACGARA
jgi:hypothetical protein